MAKATLAINFEDPAAALYTASLFNRWREQVVEPPERFCDALLSFENFCTQERAKNFEQIPTDSLKQLVVAIAELPKKLKPVSSALFAGSSDTGSHSVPVAIHAARSGSTRVAEPEPDLCPELDAKSSTTNPETTQPTQSPLQRPAKDSHSVRNLILVCCRGFWLYGRDGDPA